MLVYLARRSHVLSFKYYPYRKGGCVFFLVNDSNIYLKIEKPPPYYCLKLRYTNKLQTAQSRKGFGRQDEEILENQVDLKIRILGNEYMTANIWWTKL